MSDSSDGPTGATLSYRNVLEREIENALKEMDWPVFGTFISGISAGLNLSFGALFMAMVLTFVGRFDSEFTKQVTLAGISSIPFLFVVIPQALCSASNNFIRGSQYDDVRWGGGVD